MICNNVIKNSNNFIQILLLIKLIRKISLVKFLSEYKNTIYNLETSFIK